MAIRTYLDTSVLVALVVERDAFASRAEAFLQRETPLHVVSDYAVLEACSVFARMKRTNFLSSAQARDAIEAVDQLWLFAETLETDASDIDAASQYVRRLDLTLRAPDAVNLALAARCGAKLATFDKNMAVCATALGIELAAT